MRDRHSRERERGVLCNKHTRQTRLLGSFKSHAHKDRIAGYRLPLSRRCHERRRRRRRREPRDEEAAARRRPTDRRKREKNERASTFVKVKHRGEKCRNMSTSNVCVCVSVCLSPSEDEEEKKKKKKKKKKKERRPCQDCCLRDGGERPTFVSKRDAPDWHEGGLGPKRSLPKKKVARPTRQLFLCNHPPPPPPGTFALLPKEEEEEDS